MGEERWSPLAVSPKWRVLACGFTASGVDWVEYQSQMLSARRSACILLLGVTAMYCV